MDSSVAIAAAYLQLNGFFVLTELPVQVADRQGYRTATDVDVLAVRLPHAAELVLARRAHAQINAGYHDRDVLRFALRRTGCCALEMLEADAETLARSGVVTTTTVTGHPCRIRIASFAGQPVVLRGGELSIGLAHCTAFIRERLDRYGPSFAARTSATPC